MKIIVVVIALVLVGCKAEIGRIEPGIYTCVDTRDGEEFSFNNETAKDAEIVGFSDACLTITDFDGNDRRICRAHLDSWLKCKEDQK